MPPGFLTPDLSSARDVASRVDEDVNTRNLDALHAEVPPEQRDDEDDA